MMEVTSKNAASRVRKHVLFDVWHNHGGNQSKSGKESAVCCYVFNSVIKGELSENNQETVKRKVHSFCEYVHRRWIQAGRNANTFLICSAEWLEEEMQFEFVIQPLPSTPPSIGRATLPFNQKSERSKRRAAAQVSGEQNNDSQLLVRAATVAAKASKQSDLAVVLKEINRTPTRPNKIRKLLISPVKAIPFTQEALAFFLDGDFSKQQYLRIRISSKDKNCDIYPAYEKILQAKEKCRIQPLETNDTMAKVPLNCLVEHTIKRICSLQEDVISHLLSTTAANALPYDAKLIFSCGFDGSTGQSNYNQRFKDNNSAKNMTDSSIFATTIIPLRMISFNGTVLWNNQTPQSVRFCRPLKLQYVKETKDHIIQEKKNLDFEIQNLSITKFATQNNIMFKVKPLLFITLIDGKVFNVLTGTTSNQSCPICGATPSNFKEVKDFNSKLFNPKPNTLQFGISPLHAWIRFFECIVHIGYRCDFKKWQVRGENLKLQFAKSKAEMQEKFWSRLSLHVDKPKSNGSGSTNNGNTARRAFSEPEIFSNITNVDIRLINKFRVILIALTCQYPLDLDLFEDFCVETANLYLELYDWFPMPASVHKVLVHGKQILLNTVLPLGYFGEEASESRNKYYKRDREMHARKDSRIHNLTDIFNRAMETSDPLISSISLKNRLMKRRRINLPSAVISLLSKPDAPNLACSSGLKSDEESDKLLEDSSDELDLILETLDDIELENGDEED